MNDEAKLAIEQAICNLQSQISAAEEAVVTEAKADGEEPNKWCVKNAGNAQRTAILQIRRCVAVFELHSQLTNLFNAVE